MTHATNDKRSEDMQTNGKSLAVTIMSFGYKQGPPPTANAVFDVRFLKNPYWVEELRPLTGLDVPVQQYVMEQEAAAEFLDSVSRLIGGMVSRLSQGEMSEFKIAFGCTGGQHRSTTMAELLSKRLSQMFPDIKVNCLHRELAPTEEGEDRP